MGVPLPDTMGGTSVERMDDRATYVYVWVVVSSLELKVRILEFRRDKGNRRGQRRGEGSGGHSGVGRTARLTSSSDKYIDVDKRVALEFRISS